MTEYFLTMVLFCVGLYAVVVKRNLIKIIMGLSIMEYSVNLMLVLIGYKSGSGIPILSRENIVDIFTKNSGAMSVDPLPQALVLTSILIGLAITLVLVSIAVRLYEKYSTFDITQIKNLKG